MLLDIGEFILILDMHDLSDLVCFFFFFFRASIQMWNSLSPPPQLFPFLTLDRFSECHMDLFFMVAWYENKCEVSMLFPVDYLR